MPQDNRIPTEAQEQQTLFRWAALQQGARPELSLLYHVPNEGNRGVIGGVKAQREGLKKGVPDLCLPVSRGGYHGLYIELKRQQGAYPTEEQVWWLEQLSRNGYCVCWCRGWKEAQTVIMDYLKMGEITYSPMRGRGGMYHAGGTNDGR